VVADIDGKVSVTDRYHVFVDNSVLEEFSQKLTNLAVSHSNKLLKNPKLHNMEKSFRKVLKKASFSVLTEEEQSILKDAYLKKEGSKIVNLRGEEVKVKSR